MADCEVNGVTPEPDSTEDSTGCADFSANPDDGGEVEEDEGNFGDDDPPGGVWWKRSKANVVLSSGKRLGSMSASASGGSVNLVPFESSLNSNASYSSTASRSNSQRRRSQPLTGSVKAKDRIANRRSSEGNTGLVINYGEEVDGCDDRLLNDCARMSAGCKGPSADWTSYACSFSHIFVPTSTSGDSCYLMGDCKHSGSRVQCVACRVTTHEGCIPALNSVLACRQSYRECIRKYREQATVNHHWVRKKNLKGKCKHCAKAFQPMLGFASSSTFGMNCSWCKYSYHNKDGCLRALEDDSVCDLGTFCKVIVPPSWIVKLPRKGSFKSSLKSSPYKNKRRKSSALTSTVEEEGSEAANSGPSSSQRRASGADGGNCTPFCVKPIPSPPDVTPLLVFLNPKSGGNQGAKLMQKFQWLLNPRQVFDLTEGGPGPAIEMFRRVPNLRLLACGGDGTVGWLLSVLDKMRVKPPPAVGVLPLGTGNDLSRALGWGGGYIDEPISKIIGALSSSVMLKMDRWKLNVTRNANLPATEDKGEDELPLDVVNSYFSFGADAQIALQFHEAREANPQKFNSRIRNKMFYGQAGGKDLLLRKWKDLSEMLTVECDGQDITPKLKEHRVHSVLFANIPSFSSGTRPWNRAAGEQQIDDGMIEVMGLTTYQLSLLQAGGHASCITQCKSARIVTKKTIPMQVDGEPSRLNPATVELSFLNQAVMMAKTKGAECSGAGDSSASVELKLRVRHIRMDDYVTHHANKLGLKKMSRPYGEISTVASADLEQVRALIGRLQEMNGSSASVQQDDKWCFIDSVTAVRFFRIDRAQENLHYVLDICDENKLYILAEEDEDEDDADINELIGKSLPSLGLDPDGSVQKTTEGILKAARLGDLKMLEELHRADYSLLSVDETGKTALHYGARFGHKKVVKFVVANAPPSILDMVDNDKGQTALHTAATYKRRTISCVLVAAGASLLVTDHANLTARQLSLIAEDAELAAYLKKRELRQAGKNAGEDPESTSDFETPV